MNIKKIQTEKESDIKLPGLEQPPKIVGQDASQGTENSNAKSLVPQSPRVDNKVQLPFAWESHKYNRDFLNSADKKAQCYIVFATTFLIWMSESGNYTPLWSVAPKNWQLYDCISAISIFMLCVCILLSLLTLAPNLQGSKKGLIYFGSIAEHETKEDYLSDVLRKNEQDIGIEVLKHVYELAKICNKKFQKLKIAVWCGGIGLALGIILVLFYQPPQILDHASNAREATKIN